MRRRDFIAGAVAASTIGRARAQQKTKVYRIAVVSPFEPFSDMGENGTPAWRAGFQRLRELGYVEGQNVTVERYSGEGRAERFSELVDEVVRSNPDLIFAVGDRLALAFKTATDTIPVVTSVSDPIALGIVTSLARPGGNITGVSVDAGVEIAGKIVELLREMVPALSTVAYLASRNVWGVAVFTTALREATERMNISLVGPPIDAPFQEAEYRRTFAAIAERSADALIVNSQSENLINRRLIVDLAEEYRLPAIYYYREFAAIGGLMVYGADLADIPRRVADQEAQILRGTKPGDIPFYQPTKFHLVINLKTAKALGITVPPSLLIAADEVIE
jgi:putative ABC transport system substrate-binding protein